MPASSRMDPKPILTIKREDDVEGFDTLKRLLTGEARDNIRQ